MRTNLLNTIYGCDIDEMCEFLPVKNVRRDILKNHICFNISYSNYFSPHLWRTNEMRNRLTYLWPTIEIMLNPNLKQICGESVA